MSGTQRCRASPRFRLRRTERGVSTVLDVATCLLFVSAAATVLVAASPPIADVRSPSAAAETADVIGASTAQVQYSVARPGRGSGIGGSDPATEVARERTAHGTIGSLLAAAAASDVRVDGDRLLPSDGFADAVSEATAATTARSDAEVRVDARWEPYPGSVVAGRTSVGREPPRDVDVRAATLTVSSGATCSEERAVRAAEVDRFEGVAAVVADCVVDHLFRPGTADAAVHGDDAGEALAARRYRHAADELGTTVDTPIRRDRPARAEDRIAAELATRVAADLRANYDDPVVAAEALSIDEVRIVVRTW